jgi:hypothetical protein
MQRQGKGKRPLTHMRHDEGHIRMVFWLWPAYKPLTLNRE